MPTICADCREPIAPKRMRMHGGKPYCDECDREAHDTPCDRGRHEIDAAGDCRWCGLRVHQLPDAIERAERSVR